MAAHPHNLLTEEEYLAQERAAEFRSEYIRGEVVAMSGASRRHCRIATNLVRELDTLLDDKPCNVYSNDLRLGISIAQVYTYPDVMVVCEPEEASPKDEDTIANPTVVIEILSPSTARYDTGEKFAYYRSLASLREYLTVAQDRVHIEHHVRQPADHWLLSDHVDPDGRIIFPSLEISLPLSRIYRRVSLSKNP